MPRRPSFIVSLFVVAAALASGCSKPEDTQQSSASTAPANAAAGTASLRIAVIPKGTSHAYWKTVRLGAEAAAQELGVEMVWKGPVKENDRADQIAMVQQFVTEGISGIVLAPLDFDVLAAPVADA